MDHFAKLMIVAAAAAGMAASAQAETAVGFTVPSGKLQIASLPLLPPDFENNRFFLFGDLEIAQALPTDSMVLFWDVKRQKWSGGAKSSPVAAAPVRIRLTMFLRRWIVASSKTPRSW